MPATEVERVSLWLINPVVVFIFGHGPASPTLADVFMLTGLDIATVDDGQLFGCRAEREVETRNIGG